jgi:DNA invertase Pin-like site-specific DNA recombinase
VRYNESAASFMTPRAVIYCRVSTAHQGTDRQATELLAYADRAGFEVVGTFTEIVSGAKTERRDRAARAQVMDLARRREIDAILVTELTRWGRSTQDIVSTFNDLQAWGVSLIALNGLQLDMRTAQGKLIATLMASLAEFERDLIRERIQSGIAAAKARGKTLGRRPGDAPTQRKLGAQILALRHDEHHKLSIRKIADQLGISTATVQRVLKKEAAATTVF